MVPQLYPAATLQEDANPSRVSTTWNFSVSSDTMIESSIPVASYGSDGSASIGIDGASESRMLLEFDLNLSLVQVHSATLNLECAQGDGESAFFQTSNLTRSFNESNANWIDSNTSVAWEEMGAESLIDRSAWEPSLAVSSNGTVNLNVTRLVQQRVINSWSSMRLIVAGTDSQYECYTSDESNTSLHPTLSIEFSNNTAPSIGSLLPNWIEDGASLMTGDFILTADTTPYMTWTSLSGDAVLVQVSGSNKFRMESDFGSDWNSIDNPSMFTLASNGSMSIGSSNALSNGSTVHYRMRAMNGDQIGEWQTGWFNLPGHDITDNGDGTASLDIDADDLGLASKTIWDVELDDSQSTTPLGLETTVAAGTDSGPNQESKTLLRLNLHQLGLPANATILSSEVVFTRSAYNGAEPVALHHAANYVDWDEDTATWDSPLGNTNDWDLELGSVMDSILMDDSSNTFRFNTSIDLQTHISTGFSKPIDMLLNGRAADGTYASSTDITFYSTEDSTSSNQPHFILTYEWGASAASSEVEMLAPLAGEAVWNINDHNLSGNSTPELTWNGSASSSNEILYQLSDDQHFSNLLKDIDTSTDNDFQPSDGSINITSGDGLSTGAMYWWRMAQIDSNGRWSAWNEQSFFITDLTSTWLGGNEYQFRLRDGNASTDGKHPDCKDTYIDSGTANTPYDDEEEMQVLYDPYGSTSILFGCQLLTHLLPSGYAVTEATLRLKQSYNSGNPYIGAYESNQHNWTEETATWNSYDGRNSWGTAGAKGWERGQLLSSTTVTSSSATWIEWNVTLGVQNSMRDGTNFDVILAILGAGTSTREALFYGNANAIASRAELVFTYIPGSSALPDQPIPLSPANGSWSVEDGIEPKAVQNPLFNWNYTSNTNASGFVIDIDSNVSFESADLLSYGSWTSSGFDLTNMTFQVPVDLDIATTWYWRVRGVSDTNQIGHWSQHNFFHIPDLTTWSIDNDTAAVELHHHKGMPSLQLPHFIDTWIASQGSDLNSSHGSANTLEIGERTDGSIATALMKIPIADFPMPQNATLKTATLNLYPEWGSSSNQRISIHTLNGTWNESATGMTRDGSLNWSAPGALGGPDANRNFVDVQDVSATNWMTFDITEIAQSVHASGTGYIQLLIMGDSDAGLVEITSVDSSNDQPWLNLTWTTGAQSTPESTANTLSPLNGDILWNNSGVALLPSGSPTFEWSHANSSSIDAWRLFLSEDYNDDREGWVIYDSREVLGFDINTLEFTPAFNISNGDSYRWFVQPIVDDVYGGRGNITSFHLPLQTGAALNSTDAYAVFQDGVFIPAASYPDVFKDTWLDQYNPNANHGSNGSLVVGDSPHSSSSSANILIEINLSSIPIRNPYEVVNASLSLYKMGGGDSGAVNVSISPLLPIWSESTSSWNYRNSTVNWQTGGARGSLDASLPVDTLTTFDSGWYTWDISHAMQVAHITGLDKVKFLLQGEGLVRDWHEFASSEFTGDISYRPALNVTWRSGNAWLPSDASGQNPAHQQTMWDYTAQRPSPANPSLLNWSSGDGNLSEWQLQVSNDQRFFSSDVWTYSSTDSSSYNGSFNLTDLSYSFPQSLDLEDEWTWWRVRSLQDGRIGNWTSPIAFRLPDAQGSDDGNGNHSLTLYRDSIFRNTGSLPSVPDGWIDSSSQSTQHGSSTNLTLGLSYGGSGQSSVLIEYDLNEMPFPANMTPTQVLLRLYRTTVIGGSAVTISAHACDSFSQGSLSFNNAPTCNNTEITRSTLGVLPPDSWMEWDITSLAQSNVANGNRTLTVMLTPVGTPLTTMSFHSSEYYNLSLRPQLILGYVDNSAGVIPPAQPTLVTPSDGLVLYQEDNWMLSADRNPEFDWNDVVDATGYVFTISSDAGQTKYKSWEDSRFNGSSFTLNNSLDAGSSHQWWVQAINGSIPGPSSSRWSFAVGNPVGHTNNSDLTWTYQVRQGQEVPELGHPDLIDGWIGNASPTASHSDENILVGSSCGQGSTTYHQCRGMFSIDVSDLPLPANASVHSASVYFNVMFVDGLNGATGMSLSVHPLLNSPFNSQGSNWDDSSSGVPWASPGLLAGVDYGPATDSIQITLLDIGSSFWLDLTHSGLSMTSANHFILIGSTNTGQMNMEIYSSESLIESARPLVLFNYTSVDSVSITSGSGIITDADTNISFSSALYDSQGGVLSQSVEWYAENGSIDSTGLFIPHSVGTWGISACFGAVCQSIQVTVIHGAPVVHIVSPMIATITADESLDIEVKVLDQHGNLVSQQNIQWQHSNGSLAPITPSNGWNEAQRFFAWTAGQQTVNVSWNNIPIEVEITVNTGSPSHFEMSPCSENVAAGEDCQFTFILRDAKMNELQLSEAGNISWQVDDGNMTIAGLYSADKVGTWYVNLSSANGASASSMITVAHGLIDHLRVDVSNESVSADDIVWLNTTRVDIRGNELPIELPANAWEIQSGTLTNGTTAQWDPAEVGNRWIKASLESKTTTVYINVAHGVIVEMTVERFQDRDGSDVAMANDSMTTDDEDRVVLRSWGTDFDGNRWTIDATWSLSVSGVFAQICETTTAPSCSFEADVARSIPYEMRATYASVDGSEFFTTVVYFNVSHGVLDSLEFISDQEQDITMTVDDDIEFEVILRDGDGNQIPTEGLAYSLSSVGIEGGDWQIELDSGISDDGIIFTPGMGNIAILGQADMYASDVVGEYLLTVSIDGLEESATINVSHGDVVRFEIDDNQYTHQIIAGQTVEVSLYAFDKAGNRFITGVDWNGLYDGQSTWNYEGIGSIKEIDTASYQITLTKTTGLSISEASASSHKFSFTHPMVSTPSQLNISVLPAELGVLELVMLSDTVDQLGSIELTIKAFDTLGNEVLVPTSISVSASGRGTTSMVDGNFSHWSIETLDEGKQTVSIEAVNKFATTIDASGTYSVEGNIGGFFESGGTTYYIGAGLGVFVLIAMIVVVGLLVRRSGSGYDEYDDDDDDDDEYSEPEGPTTGPTTGPTSGPMSGPMSGPTEGPAQAPSDSYHQPAYQEQSYQETPQEDSYRVDENGTEWWEDELGTWWFKAPGDAEWSEWRD